MGRLQLAPCGELDNLDQTLSISVLRARAVVVQLNLCISKTTPVCRRKRTNPKWCAQVGKLALTGSFLGSEKHAEAPHLKTE